MLSRQLALAARVHWYCGGGEDHNEFLRAWLSQDSGEWSNDNHVLKQGTTKNVFVSPSSVMLALAMTYNGAEGETRQAMARALEIEGLSLPEVNRAFADLKSTLGTADPKLQLRIANSLWAKKGVSLKPDFIQRSKEYYAAEVTSLDFNNPTAPATINLWVKTTQTTGLKK